MLHLWHSTITVDLLKMITKGEIVITQGMLGIKYILDQNFQWSFWRKHLFRTPRRASLPARDSQSPPAWTTSRSWKPAGVGVECSPQKPWLHCYAGKLDHLKPPQKKNGNCSKITPPKKKAGKKSLGDSAWITSLGSQWINKMLTRASLVFW